MEAKELMIGDWVYDTLSQTDIKVNRGCFETNPLNGICYAENLIPIPLAAEILEKNGFIRDMFYGVWEFDLDPFPFVVVQRKDNSWYLGREEYGISKYRESIDISYVHQLQHALRLCEIDKEIEL